ncbi:hypothetical protein DSO57_1003465 [Entomophthora muscae]|uniref:Uncharacterized protein n=1 Tax=Entomophthora muscae TaxID=34485 RepID=A0ACC2UU88_9FUNG|nr:hypothetical protein DSO57_1003465 [Entomophthora muscae]
MILYLLAAGVYFGLFDSCTSAVEDLYKWGLKQEGKVCVVGKYVEFNPVREAIYKTDYCDGSDGRVAYCIPDYFAGQEFTILGEDGYENWRYDETKFNRVGNKITLKAKENWG